MTSVRQPKPQRKGGPNDAAAARRQPAWTGARASPTFSPGVNNARLPNGPSAASGPAGTFPPLNPPTPTPRADIPKDRTLLSLAGLTGTTITLSTKTAQRYEGVVGSTNGEGDTTGVTLRDVKEISDPGAPLKATLFIAATNIENWASGPADAKAPNGDSFKTDTDISQKTPRRERELQAWSGGDAPPAPGPGGHGHSDDITFGAGASSHSSWDQFAANEKLFGVKTGFDEELYTTKLDRSASDFKERERKAQALANEIMGTAANNPHIAEERVMNNLEDNEGNEEDKYGAVVRGNNAYVPPGARKLPTASANGTVPKVSVNAPDGTALPQSETQTPSASSKAPSPAPSASNKPPADALPAFRDFVTNEKQRLTQKKQALVKNERDKRMADLLKFSKDFKLNKPIPDDLVTILAKDQEKQRLIREKSARDAASGHARAIGVIPPLADTTSPPPPSTAKIAPSASGAVAGAPSSKLPVSPSVGTALASAKVPPVTAGVTPKTSTAAASVKSGRIAMSIQSIPPFKGSKPTAKASTSTSGSPAAVPAAPAAPVPKPAEIAANKLNVNASSFRPNPKAVAFTPASPNTVVSPASSIPDPKAKTESGSSSPPVPNPFFGTRVLKKQPVHVKDDFNPFKYNKVVEASAVNAIWPYQGKRYMQMFPPVAMQPQQQSPHMAPPGPPPIPPPSYEEDSAAQAAARGYVYAYPPYGYPGQPMMPGMAPPPPGAYMPAPFMQHMPYPPNMPPPNAMYASPQMGQMPPPQAYMQPPPGQYPPPPNGAGPRPSMPPTPIPAHAHPYYHQSPQRMMLPLDPYPVHNKMFTTPTVQHAVPYPMMMPPPGQNGPPHGYDGGPPPPVPMGGHA
ncbi:hypothetical protein FA95DRAFT_1684189 [Auriscalpium vulgare]|uniref:Uncharacterized protein n=1 Tax=Auriscalpium vulgare TaxID=40419 RepID=A0ACB8R6Z6_9AGAM|nr:hypothetical protein FA95DRAFT_1684189 [Auriscalpium vulgare]